MNILDPLLSHVVSMFFSPITSRRTLTLVVHGHTYTQMPSSFKASAKQLSEFHLHQFLLLAYCKGVFPCLTSTHSFKYARSGWRKQHFTTPRYNSVLWDHVSHEHKHSLIIWCPIHGEHLCCVLLNFFATSDYQLNRFCSSNLLFLEWDHHVSTQ